MSRHGLFYKKNESSWIVFMLVWVFKRQRWAESLYLGSIPLHETHNELGSIGNRDCNGISSMMSIISGVVPNYQAVLLPFLGNRAL